MKDDIAKYMDWYWTEVSDVMEHYFEKHGGVSIPNIYVAMILNRETNPPELDQDGYHYFISIPGLEEPVKKKMFGFKNKEVYDRIKDELIACDNFSNLDHNKKVQESFGMNAEKISASVAVDFINNLYETYCCYGYYELPRYLIDRLHECIATLENYSNRNEVREDLELAKELSLEIAPLEIHRFPNVDPIEHVVL